MGATGAPGASDIMRRGEKAGRNDPCPCGSGEKYKRCCEKKARGAGPGGAITLIVLVGVLIVAIVVAITSITQDPAPTGSRRVWSPEHGHYHNVP
jgi:hypothetical protein